jgi:peptide/nickel transport system permease protein
MGEIDPSPFEIVGMGYKKQDEIVLKKSLLPALKKLPWLSIIVLSIIVSGCVFADRISNHDPTMYYLDHINEPPSQEFYFGTDSMGRDLYSIIWYGGRTSLMVGMFGMVLVTLIGITYGSINGMVNTKGDLLMQRIVEIFHCIPTLLLALLLLGIMGKQSILTITVVIAIVSWFALARIVRSEVRQIRNNEYVLAAKAMGSDFPHLVRVHLIPNIIPAIMFVVISSISGCITMEATLSFLGIGLPLDILSWGSILSLANRALLTNTWWVIIFPGIFLIATLTCISSIANAFRRDANKKPNRL